MGVKSDSLERFSDDVLSYRADQPAIEVDKPLISELTNRQAELDDTLLASCSVSDAVDTAIAIKKNEKTLTIARTNHLVDGTANIASKVLQSLEDGEITFAEARNAILSSLELIKS